MIEVGSMKTEEYSMDRNKKVGSVRIPNMMFGKNGRWIRDLWDCHPRGINGNDWVNRHIKIEDEEKENEEKMKENEEKMKISPFL